MQIYVKLITGMVSLQTLPEQFKKNTFLPPVFSLLPQKHQAL
jgi:hypothetical protein